MLRRSWRRKDRDQVRIFLKRKVTLLNLHYCSSAIIQQLQLELHRNDAKLAYFYFDYSDIAKRNAANLLSTVAWQLATQRASSLKQLERWSTDQASFAPFKGWHEPPTPSMLEDLLATMIKTLKVVLVVDAVDESDDMKAVVS
jgi:hypothetical protein